MDNFYEVTRQTENKLHWNVPFKGLFVVVDIKI
jgi:hypothetical protein